MTARKRLLTLYLRVDLVEEIHKAAKAKGETMSEFLRGAMSRIHETDIMPKKKTHSQVSARIPHCDSDILLEAAKSAGVTMSEAARQMIYEHLREYNKGKASK